MASDSVVEVREARAEAGAGSGWCGSSRWERPSAPRARLSDSLEVATAAVATAAASVAKVVTPVLAATVGDEGLAGGVAARCG